MDTKAAFEKFVIKHDPSGHCTNLLAMNEAGINYLHPHVDIAWIAWQASRAAIEIDLEHLCYIQVEEGTFYLDEGSVEAALTSHGIRIKGKTECDS